MADHPLKPATDRRLGRPLPHQLPNQTRADPSPINLSPEGRMRYYSPFPVAIPQRRARSHALLTRPPLNPKVSLDLHVLGLPPAFVLSQDQTLKLKCCCQHILDVRTSAHLIRWLNLMKSLFVCFSLLRNRKPTNSEADTPSSGQNPKSVIYRRRSVENRPNRPHISSVFYQCQTARDKNPTSAP